MKSIFIISFIELFVLINPIFAHSEHYHTDTYNKKSDKEAIKPQINDNKMDSLKENKTNIVPNQIIEHDKNNLEKVDSPKINMIPQPTEVIFLLIIGNPFLLYLIKRNYAN